MTVEWTTELKESVSRYLLDRADDALILGHRNSEWCGHAPILEEDIAYANIALDEIGHATVWYGIYAELNGEDRDTYPDQLVYARAATDYRNAPMMELPKGDWAFSMLRQYLYDAGETIRLRHLMESAYPPIAQAATKIRAETVYHLRHSSAWVRRLGSGTEESQRRMQQAFDTLWTYAVQYLALPPYEQPIAAANLVPSTKAVLAEWYTSVTAYLTESNLAIPEIKLIQESRESHTPDLAELLDSLQALTQQYPDSRW